VTIAIDYPVYERDIFARDALRHPFEHFRAIRDLGPVVSLADTGLLAMGRFADVQQALRTPDVLISGEGAGLNDIFNSQPPNILASDGELHRLLRSNVARKLTPGAVRVHRADFKHMIVEQVRACTNVGWFEGVEALAQFLPLSAISHLVGLPEEARQKMLHWATANFDMQQPFKPELAGVAETLKEAMDFLFSVERSQLRPGSWSELMFQEVDNGRMSEEHVYNAIGALTFPSLDTTIHSKSGMLYFLGDNPDQWEILKNDPSLVPSTVLESVRLSSVVRWFTRVAATDYRAGDVFVPEGARVALLYGSANRDERHYPNADRFDARRNPIDNLGWGTGPHICVGMHLAKLEMEVLLEALIENVDRIEVEDPVPSANGGLYGFEALQMRLTRN
jgi:cytochrome P450